MEFAERCDIADAIVGAVGERFGVRPEEMMDISKRQAWLALVK